jgi:hypothetical protein
MSTPSWCMPGCGVCWDIAVLAEQRAVHQFHEDLSRDGLVAALERFDPRVLTDQSVPRRLKLQRTRVRGLPIPPPREIT